MEILGITKSQTRLSSWTTIFREGRENEPYFKENLRGKKKNKPAKSLTLHSLGFMYPQEYFEMTHWKAFLTTDLLLDEEVSRP